MKTVDISFNDAGCRLDRFVRKHLPLHKLSDIYKLIRKGGIKVNGNKVAQNYRLCRGDRVQLNVAEEEFINDQKVASDSLRTLVSTKYFSRNFKIIYEDANIIACDKPCSLVVHPGTAHVGYSTLIDLAKSYILSKPQTNLSEEALLVHRLDKDTSGVILIAKNKAILRFLHEKLRTREIKKCYIAICHGAPPQSRGIISLELIRSGSSLSGTKMRVDDAGQHCLTHYESLQTTAYLSKLRLYPETGRTHQLRVHLAHCGFPIVGDTRYGDERKDDALFESCKIRRRLFLHAYSISFYYPPLKKNLTLNSPLPGEFEQLFSFVERVK